MPKPVTAELSDFVQHVVAQFEGVMKHHIENHPQMAKEEKMATLVEGGGHFKNHAAEMQASEHGVRAQNVGDQSRGNSTGRA